MIVALCAVLSAAGLRSLVRAVPSAPPPAAAISSPRPLAAEAFAESFARVFLTWGEDASARTSAVRRFAPQLADELERAAHAPAGSQEVLWSAVAGSVAVPDGRRVKILAQTTNGEVALSVTVAETSMSELRVTRPPALVGTPPSPQRLDGHVGDPVSDGELGATITRALRSYLRRSGDALLADLLPGARVLLPDVRLRLRELDDLTWAQGRRSVLAEVTAADESGGELLLAYELGVSRQAGRWFVRWIEDPTTREAGP